MPSAETTQKLARIEGIIFDVDGVLTDGRITYAEDGKEIKAFHVQDGASLKLLIEKDIAVGIITGRKSPMVAKRMRELGIGFVVQGASSKPQALLKLIEAGFPGQNIAAVGDDLQDLSLFKQPQVTCTITVANGHPAVLAQADWTTQRSGGSGVAAEVAMHLLQAQDLWPH